MILQDWMNVKRAAEYGAMHPKVLERLARKRKIRSGKHGRSYRFKPEWIDSYLMRRGFDGRGGAQ